MAQYFVEHDIHLSGGALRLTGDSWPHMNETDLKAHFYAANPRIFMQEVAFEEQCKILSQYPAIKTALPQKFVEFILNHIG